MKQNYILYLMGLLSIGQMAFSSEMEDLFKQAETLQQAGNTTAALKIWGEMADIVLPLRDYTKADPYISDRSMQTDAREKVRDAAVALESAGNLAGALTIYNYAPRTFASKINELKRLIAQ